MRRYALYRVPILVITMMIFLVAYFVGAPSGLGALRTARGARYGSGGADSHTASSQESVGRAEVNQGANTVCDMLSCPPCGPRRL